MQSISVPASEAGRRLDKYLMKYLDAAPKSFIYKAFRKKNIKLCGKRADGSEIVSSGDTIELFFSDETLASLKTAAKRRPDKQSDAIGGIRGVTRQAAIRENKAGLAGSDGQTADEAGGNRLSKKQISCGYSKDGGHINMGDKAGLAGFCVIVYEDVNVILADKKAGILSQKSDRRDYSLNEALLDYCGGKSDVFVPSVCNRIDRNTTGLVCFAKTYAAARELSRIIRDRELEKYYIAAVRGVIRGENRIDAWLMKDAASNTVEVSKTRLNGAEHIETAFRPVNAYESKLLGLSSPYGHICGEEYTVLKVELITGKSHQIRAQLAGTGHPLLGDSKYGDLRLNQRLKAEYGIRYQLLHAWEMRMPDELNFPLDNIAGKTFRTAVPESIKPLMR